jgi:hypothetical protein
MWTVRTAMGEFHAKSDFDIEMWVDQNRIQATDQVFHPELQQWVPASELRGLREFFKFRRSVRSPFRAWFWSLMKHQSNGGLWGRLLIFLITPLALIACFLGVFLFPSGVYPRIVLAAPGLALVAVLVAVAAPVAYFLTARIGPVLGFVVPCPNCCKAVAIAGPRKGKNHCAACGTVAW